MRSIRETKRPAIRDPEKFGGSSVARLSESGREITCASLLFGSTGGNAMGLALWSIGTLVAAVVVANMPSGRPETPRHSRSRHRARHDGFFWGRVRRDEPDVLHI